MFVQFCWHYPLNILLDLQLYILFHFIITKKSLELSIWNNWIKQKFYFYSTYRGEKSLFFSIWLPVPVPQGQRHHWARVTRVAPNTTSALTTYGENASGLHIDERTFGRRRPRGRAVLPDPRVPLRRKVSPPPQGGRHHRGSVRRRESLRQAMGAPSTRSRNEAVCIS